MWASDHKESWTLKNRCFPTMVLDPLDCKEIKPVHPKGNQSWIFTGRTDAEAETPVFWPPDTKNQLTGKKLWCWERLKAGGEGDNRGWDGWMASPTNGHEFDSTPGIGNGQTSLACCSPWDCKVRHDWMTELNWTEFLKKQVWTVACILLWYIWIKGKFLYLYRGMV